MKILVVGGQIEIPEVEKISEGLMETGHTPLIHQFEIGGSKKSDKLLLKRIKSEKPDIVFSRNTAYPQPRRTNLFISEHLHKLGIPFVGCEGRIVRTLRNKAECDILLRDAQFPFSNDFILINPWEQGRNAYGRIINKRGFTDEELSDPFQRHSVLFIKPNSYGRSKGITDESVVHNLDELVKRSAQIKEEIGKNRTQIITPFYPGREYTVGIIGNKNKIILPVEVCQREGYSKNNILPHDVKVEGIPSKRVYIKPIDNVQTINKLMQATISILDILNITDYTRIDFREGENGQFYAIDINGVPGVKYMESYISMAAEEAFRGQKQKFSIYGQLTSSIVSASADRFNLPHENHPTLFNLENKLLKGK